MRVCGHSNVMIAVVGVVVRGNACAMVIADIVVIDDCVRPWFQ